MGTDCLFFFLPCISLIIAFTALWLPEMESLYGRLDLPLTPYYGSNWGHKIADFLFLPYISFKATLLTKYSFY